MTFSDDLLRFVTTVRDNNRAVYVGVATGAHESITVGSPITGAPGQPVDTGNLRSSFTLDIGVDEATISTNVAYAPLIEEGIAASGKPISFKSAVGGAHSVKQTIAGANALQEHVRAGLGA